MRNLDCVRSNKSQKFSRKLAAYSSLAVGTGAGLCSACDADAAVVPFVPVGAPRQFDPGVNFHFKVDSDSETDFALFGSGGRYFLGDYFGAFGYLGSNRVLNDGSLAAIVAPGGTVGPDASAWLTNIPLDNFIGTRGYAGIVFDIPGGSPHFGYLDIAISADSRTLTLYGGAYESLANTPIQVPVPEPASLVFLAGGAAGLAAWRRRRGRAESNPVG
jgi:hypothetical protein